MTAIAGRVGLHARQQRIAAEHVGEVLAANIRLVDAEQPGNLRRPRQQRRRTHWGRLDPGVTGTMHLAHMPPQLGIAGQIAHKAVVESKVSHGGNPCFLVVEGRAR